MELINRDKDFHMHTINWSDGMNTVDELVQFAGKLGLKEIAITDHSRIQNSAFGRSGVLVPRGLTKRYENVHNDVIVRFGVEGDVLNEEGDVCFDIDGVEGEIIVLSAHLEAYSGKPEHITKAYINAIRRFHDKITCIGHLDAHYFGDFVDMLAVITEANKYHIPLEFNCKAVLAGFNIPEHTKLLLDTADRVMLNSDAHCLVDLKNREKGFAWLKENGYIDD